MNATVEDLRPTIVPKSDQLNAEQLLGGPMTVTVSAVQVSNSPEQPVTVHYEGEQGRPFKPCKTMRKLLVLAWGADGTQWPGRSMTLYNDPAVKFGGDEVGGIRISHISHVPKDLKVSLTSTRGKKALYLVQKLDDADARHLSDIRAAENLEALKDIFGKAWKATKVESRRGMLKQAYDKRVAELSKPAEEEPETAAKTLEQYREAIDNALDADMASQALEEARAVLPAGDIEELQQAFTTAWEN